MFLTDRLLLVKLDLSFYITQLCESDERPQFTASINPFVIRMECGRSVCEGLGVWRGTVRQRASQSY